MAPPLAFYPGGREQAKPHRLQHRIRMGRNAPIWSLYDKIFLKIRKDCPIFFSIPLAKRDKRWYNTTVNR